MQAKPAELRRRTASAARRLAWPPGPPLRARLRATDAGSSTPQAQANVGQHALPGQQAGILERHRYRAADRQFAGISRSRPARARRRVDLPSPLRPSRATNSPGAMSRSRPTSTSATVERPAQPASPGHNRLRQSESLFPARPRRGQGQPSKPRRHDRASFPGGGPGRR